MVLSAVPTPGAETNALGMRFVAVPSTRILMCTTETTVAQYRLCGREYKTPRFAQGDNHPAVNISWEDAKAFCRWLSEREKKPYRLPTDAEWSSAAGSSLYPFGDGLPQSGDGNYAGQEMKRLAADELAKHMNKGFMLIPGLHDGHVFTAPIGISRPNRLGIYDLGGNVWEWCEDEYRAAMNSAEALEKFPVMRLEKDRDGSAVRVLRGASWSTDAPLRLRSEFRLYGHPRYQGPSRGFRVVIEIR